MSIRNIVAKSTLGKSDRPKEYAGDWDMTTPAIPGVDEEQEPDAIIATVSTADTDTVDNFILSYFALFGQDKKPADRQLHALAYSVGLKPENLQEEIYAMLGRIADSDEIVTQDI